MKIGKEEIEGLTDKKTVGGIRYYWQPSPKLRKAGWTGLTLSTDLVKAIAEAKARNEAVEQWKAGGTRPKEVEKFQAPGTLGDLIKRYRAEHLETLGANTQSTDSASLNRLEAWAGDQRLSFVTRQRVKVLRDAMMRPKEKGGTGHAAAFNTLKTARAMFAWAMRQDPPLAASNPFTDHGLPAPPPRDQRWDDPDLAAFAASAEKLQAPGMGFAIELALYMGQRQADMLKLTDRNWREIRNLPPEDAQRLMSHHGPDAGKVMGFGHIQNKGSHTRKVKVGDQLVGVHRAPVWQGAPIEGAMRDRVEKRIAEIRANDGATVQVRHILVDERTGLPWKDRFQFISRFNEVKDHAMQAAADADDMELAGRLADLQFRDLRRTCVVRLGELGLEDQLISAITGHKLETVKKILEVYMPRTTKMAARAIIARIGDRPTPAADQEQAG